MTLSRNFVAILIILSGCVRTTVSDEEAVKKVVNDYYDGIKLKDHQAMIDACTGDFILYEQGKVWNNDSVFHEMGKYKFSVDYSFKDLNITLNGDKAYASYRAIADFVFDDTVKQKFNFIESAAFKKTNDEWKMTFLQVNDELPNYDTIHYAWDYYATRLDDFKKERFQKGGIVMVGNSIIEYGNWKKILGDSNVVNRGVAADNTFGVLKRLDEIISRQPSKIFLEIGINDVSLNTPLNIIIDNITKVVSRLHEGSPDSEIYVVSLLPTNDDIRNEYPDAYNKNRMTDIVNNQLTLRAKDGLFTYLDLNSKLSDAQGQLDRKFASKDGLHLNDEGYKIFATLIQ